MCAASPPSRGAAAAPCSIAGRMEAGAWRAEKRSATAPGLPQHPLLSRSSLTKTWIPGTSPGKGFFYTCLGTEQGRGAQDFAVGGLHQDGHALAGGGRFDG